MEAILERRGDAEVSAAAPKCPEQIGVRLLRHVEDVTVGGHELDCGDVVGRKPVLRHQPTQAASKSEAGDARGRDRATGDGEAVDGGLAIQLAPQDASLRARRPRLRVDVDPLHRRQVDHQSPVDNGAAGDIVAAAPNADVEALGVCEPNGVCDVRRVLAARDQGRGAVDQSVVDAARVLVTVVSRLQNAARHRALQRLEPLGVDTCRGCHLRLPSDRVPNESRAAAQARQPPSRAACEGLPRSR